MSCILGKWLKTVKNVPKEWPKNGFSVNNQNTNRVMITVQAKEIKIIN